MADRVSANTDDLATFVSSGQAFVVALEGLDVSVDEARQSARDALADVGGPPASSAPLLQELIVEAKNNNIYVDDLRTVLDQMGERNGAVVTASSPAVALAMEADGHRPFDGDRTLAEDLEYHERLHSDEVIAAMTAGQTPEEAGLSENFFPPGYIELKEAEAEVERLEGERDDANGFNWWPWDGNGGEVSAIDGELGDARDERDDAASAIGANGSGRITEVEAIALLGDHTGDREWEGEQYGRWTNEYIDEHYYDEMAPMPSVDGSEADEFVFVGAQIAEHSGTAVGYYNEIGVERTAQLPSVLGDQSRAMGEVGVPGVENYSTALGHASRSGDLAFTGDELINQTPLGLRDSPRAVSAYQHNFDVSVLFVTGDFESKFLTDATTAVLRRAEEDPLFTNTVFYNNDYLLDGSGEDPRNILLSRGAEEGREDVASAVVAGLDRSGETYLLLSPHTPFRLSIEVEKNTPLFQSERRPDAPITSFLWAAGTDDEAAQTILESAATDPQPFSGPDVAAGVDGIMHQHATVMYPADALEAVGIERSGIKIDAADWKTVHGKVLDHGRGQALVSATYDLTDQAIAASVEGGEFDSAAVAPFATIAGYTETQTMEATFAYAAELDENARAENARINNTVSLGFTAIGVIPHPATTVIGAAGSAIWTLWSPLEDPTNELDAYREAYLDLLYAQRTDRWEDVVYNELLGDAVEDGEIEIISPSTGQPETVVVEFFSGEDGRIGYYWRYPGSSVWRPVPPPSDPDFNALFEGTPTYSSTREIGELDHRYDDGVAAATDDPEAIVDAQDGAQINLPEVETSDQRVASGIQRAELYDIDEWVADG